MALERLQEELSKALVERIGRRPRLYRLESVVSRTSLAS